ncbi:MAG: T9SS type A sorting domain-containing protein [Ekhidna sp.]|uniref:T9SS type A sorting domain-containing protein n=1 Tax=Ekhidna sp. TaxID=2608089 RepID=UPI0032ECDA38
MFSFTSPHQGVVASFKIGLLAISPKKSFNAFLFTLIFSFTSHAQVLINEVVTDPQVDWSTNAFDGSDGLGIIDSNDEWIELYVTANGVDLTGWTIELNDGTNTSGTLAAGGAFTISNYISGTGGLFTDTDAGDYLVIGQPTSGSMDATITVILRDNTSAIVDQVIIAAGSGTFFTGASTGITDESVCRIPNGQDTDIEIDDFVLTQSTMGANNSPTGVVLVNEVVTDPQQDWSTNGFDGSDGGGTINGDDDWVELYIGSSGLNLTKWIIELNDGTDESGLLTAGGAFQIVNYFSQTGGTFTDTDAGDYLVLGEMTSGAMNQSVTVVLRDAYSNVVDQVEIASGSGTMFTGDANDINDESVCRIPNGQDTDVEANDFVQTRATLGANNSPQGIVLINEVVTDPQQDWSASGFTDPASGGTAGSNDEWIELYIGTSGLNLIKWNIAVIDGTDFSGDLTSSGAFTEINYVGAGSFNNTVAGDYLILGNPISTEQINDDVYITLTDPYGVLVDDVEIGDDEEGDGAGDGAADGSVTGGLASSIADEAIFRVPLAEDTDDDVADFRKGLASLGAENGIVYVDASAPDDTGFGRQSDPKQLIQSGLDIAVEDGRVMVAAGTYSENILITNPVSLEGANAGIDGNGTRGAESIIEPLAQSDALEIDADSVTIDGFQIGIANVDAGIYSTSDSYLTVQNNVINADSVGIAFVAGSSGTYNITSNLITTSDFTTASSNLTSAVTLAGLNVDADVNLNDNDYSGSALGIFIFDCLSTNVLSITNDTTVNSIRGITVFSSNGITRASSSITVDGFSASNFAEPPGGIFNFPEAGIYFFTDGASTNSHLITATITNSNFEGVENTTSDYSGIICGDFSGTNYTEYLQDITILNCQFTDNENRGFFARGQNTRAIIQQSSFTRNGFDPTATGGNPGFSIIARNNAEITVSNSTIINAATLAGAEDIPGNYYTSGLHISAGGSLTVSGSNLDQNGNGFIAQTSGIDLSGNHFNTTDEAIIQSLVGTGNDFTPWINSGTDTDLITPGFQADFDALTVGTLSAQTAGDRIQEAHDLLNAGGIITILQDDYAETLTVGKDISIDPEAGTTIDDVTLDGGRLNVLADLEINNLLTLTNGILDIDLDDGEKSDDPVLILNSAVAGSFDDANHIEGIAQAAIGAASTFDFPVGDADSYRPVALTPTNAATFNVSHIEAAAPSGGGVSNPNITDLITDASTAPAGFVESVLNFRYWTINASGTPGTTDVTLQIPGGDNASDPAFLGMTRFDGSDWVLMSMLSPATGSDPFLITAQTTDFSDFSIYSTDVDANPLPVELIDFTGRIEGRDVRLSWATLSEINSDYFLVERSEDGKTFKAIGSVSSHGNTNVRHDYTYLDMNAGERAYYYRLKMIDFDGYFEYSPTIQIIPDLSNVKVLVYPNPSSGFIQIHGISAATIRGIYFYDLNGKLHKHLDSITNSNVNLSDLQSGHYLLRMEMIDGSVFEGEVIRE